MQLTTPVWVGCGSTRTLTLGCLEGEMIIFLEICLAVPKNITYLFCDPAILSWGIGPGELSAHVYKDDLCQEGTDKHLSSQKLETTLCSQGGPSNHTFLQASPPASQQPSCCVGDPPEQHQSQAQALPGLGLGSGRFCPVQSYNFPLDRPRLSKSCTTIWGSSRPALLPSPRPFRDVRPALSSEDIPCPLLSHLPSISNKFHTFNCLVI